MKTLPLTLSDSVIKPVRLCLIERRDGTVLRIAEAPSAVVVGANTYTPVAGLEISGVKHAVGGEPQSMEIVAAHSSGGVFDTEDIDKGLYDAADVKVFAANRASLLSLGLMFTGTIQPIGYDTSGRVSFDIRGVSSEANTGYIQTFSPMCRTDLFSPLCGLDSADFAYTATVNAIINRFNFTVSGMMAPPGSGFANTPTDGWLNLGVIVTAGGIAFECANWIEADLQVTAYLPCSEFITAGEGLTLHSGCNKTIANCRDKFANTISFMGEPHSTGVAAAVAG